MPAIVRHYLTAPASAPLPADWNQAVRRHPERREQGSDEEFSILRGRHEAQRDTVLDLSGNDRPRQAWPAQVMSGSVGKVVGSNTGPFPSTAGTSAPSTLFNRHGFPEGVCAAGNLGPNIAVALAAEPLNDQAVGPDGEPLVAKARIFNVGPENMLAAEGINAHIDDYLQSGRFVKAAISGGIAGHPDSISIAGNMRAVLYRAEVPFLDRACEQEPTPLLAVGFKSPRETFFADGLQPVNVPLTNTIAAE